MSVEGKEHLRANRDLQCNHLSLGFCRLHCFGRRETVLLLLHDFAPPDSGLSLDSGSLQKK